MKNILLCKCVAIVLLSLNVAMAQTVTLLPYRKIDKWGFCDSAAQIVIPPTYDEVDFFGKFNEDFPSLALVVAQHKRGLINKKGAVIIAAVYDDLEPIPIMGFQNKFVKMKMDGKWGLLSYDGKTIAKAEFTFLDVDRRALFHSTPFVLRFVAAINEQYYVLDLAGTKRKISKSEFEKITQLNLMSAEDPNNYYFESNDNPQTYAVADTLKKYGITIDEYRMPHSSFYKIRKDGKVGAYNKAAFFLPPLYDDVLEVHFDSQKFLVRLNGEIGMVALNGTVLLPYQHCDNAQFNDDASVVVLSKNDLKGLYVLRTQTLIQPKYLSIKESVVVPGWRIVYPVYFNYRWGYISDTGIPYFED
jgi:hypothetical protein